jgi:transcriptional regulator with XRE-family HTH domain
MIRIDEKALAQQVGRCMRQARHARKWTQEHVAALIGVSMQFYGRIERGEGLPGMETFVDLLLLFDLSPSAVLGLTDASTAPVVGDVPLLRRIARRLRRASPRALAVVRWFLDELDKLRGGTDAAPPARVSAHGVRHRLVYYGPGEGTCTMSEQSMIIIASEAGIAIRSVRDISDAIGACFGAAGIVFVAEDFGPAFFDLRTGLAGELFQKLMNYRVRAAIVLPHPEAHGERFRELAYEHRSHDAIRFVSSRAEADAWLRA